MTNIRLIDKSHAITRTVNPALEEILGWAFPVLDKGFVRVIDYMGDQSSIVQMARVSYGDGTKHVSEDVGLIRYLMRHRHSSPFEGCEIKMHVKLPVFVARQWIRHRMASVNEYSARYSILKNEFYLPDRDDVKAQSTSNRQGADGELEPFVAADFLTRLDNMCSGAFEDYENAIDDNVAREQARIGLPLNTYTEWYWKIDLHNLLHFLSLRMDKHAQYEIRVYADLIFHFVQQWMPGVAKAFEDYRLNAVTLSGPTVSAIKGLLSSHCNPDEFLIDLGKRLRADGASTREVDEVIRTLEPSRPEPSDHPF